MNKFFPKKSGFSLIETIVAITVLIAAITGPLTLALHSLHASRNSMMETTATYLTEEGLEAIYSIRDNDSAVDGSPTHANWSQTILADCGSGCVVDVTAHNGGSVWGSNALSCPSLTCSADQKKIYKNPDTGIMRQKNGGPGTWVATPYSRYCTVANIVAGKQLRVTCTVTYVEYSGGPLHTITISEDLYNWFPLLY